MRESQREETQTDTRLNILKAAAEVFSEVGYQAATTREICGRAGVNIAAVNYHFRDKLALFTELVTSTASTVDRSAVDEEMGTDASPEDALRFFLHRMFEQLGNPARPAWPFRVMMHELGNPTPGLSAVVEHVLRPNVLMLCEIVGRIIHKAPLDIQTRLCAHSIIGQVAHHIQSGPVLDRLWPEWDRSHENFSEIADHIANFSLAALTKIAEQPDEHDERTTRSRDSNANVVHSETKA